jgi:lysophospholipase L1-like esterase
MKTLKILAAWLFMALSISGQIIKPKLGTAATADLSEIYASAFDSVGVVPYRLPVTLSPYTDAAADAAITAASVTDETAKTHYQRVVQTLKGLGIWASLDNAYLLGTKYQSSSTTLKSLTGTSDATGTSTFSDYHATFNGTSDKYLFTNVNAATNAAGKTFVAVYEYTGVSSAVNALISNYAGGATRGPALQVGGSVTLGNGSQYLDNLFALASLDGTALTQSSVEFATDLKWSFGAMSLSSGVLSAYGNCRNPSRSELATLWANNANNCIGANLNSTHYFAGEMVFAAVFNAGLTDAQMFALKVSLESIFSTTQTLSGGIVFEGNSLTASAPGGGTTWPAQLLATTNWTTATRSQNIALDGALQTGRVENQYFTVARKWLPMAGQDSIFFLWSGINDITASVTTAKITTSLRREIIRARLDGFRVVALTLTPVAPTAAGLTYGYTAGQLTQISDINTWLRETGPSLGAQIVDLDEIGVANPAFLTPWVDTYYVTGDGLHHNDSGRALIAAKVAAEVSPPAVP